MKPLDSTISLNTSEHGANSTLVRLMGMDGCYRLGSLQDMAPENREHVVSCWNLIHTITTYGLSLRQVPMEVISLSDMRHHVEGNEIVLSPMTVLPGQYANRKAWFLKHTGNAEAYVFDDVAGTIHRKFTKTVRVPEYAGHWMCQRVGGTSTRVEWSLKHHHLAPSLAESVALFLSSIKP